MKRDSYTTFLIRKKYLATPKYYHASNHINDHPKMVNHTLSGHKRRIFSAVNHFLLKPRKSQGTKQKECYKTNPKLEFTTII